MILLFNSSHKFKGTREQKVSGCDRSHSNGSFPTNDPNRDRVPSVTGGTVTAEAPHTAVRLRVTNRPVHET